MNVEDSCHRGIINYITCFISMKQSNISDFQGKIEPFKDVVFIYDIDNTLYKYSKEYKERNRRAYVDIYNKIVGESKDLSGKVLPDLMLALEKGNIMIKLFRNEFKKTPLELERLRGDIDLHDYIKRDEELVKFLSTFKYRVWCFTNGLESRARKILEILDITNYIEGVICLDELDDDFMSKPNEASYEFVEKILGIEDKKRIYFFDDNRENIEAALERGWNGILVERDDNIIGITRGIVKKLGN